MDYDVIVIGAGPAGASAAFWLGEAGKRGGADGFPSDQTSASQSLNSVVKAGSLDGAGGALPKGVRGARREARCAGPAVTGSIGSSPRAPWLRVVKDAVPGATATLIAARTRGFASGPARV